MSELTTCPHLKTDFAQGPMAATKRGSSMDSFDPNFELATLEQSHRRPDPTRTSAVGLSRRREALRGCPLFRPLTAAELEAVLTRAVMRRVMPGDVILRCGDPASGMMVILHGRIRVSITAAEGHEISLAVLGPGEVVGEIALLDGGERSTDVTAIDEGVLLTIQRSDFLPLLQESASLCLRLMQVLCGRLREANRSLEELATLSLRARLGRLLLRLAANYGTRVGKELRLEVRLSQKDLGTLIGASREKVNRQIRVWEQAGALMHERGYLIICKPEILASSA